VELVEKAGNSPPGAPVIALGRSPVHNAHCSLGTLAVFTAAQHSFQSMGQLLILDHHGAMDTSLPFPPAAYHTNHPTMPPMTNRIHLVPAVSPDSRSSICTSTSTSSFEPRDSLGNEGERREDRVARHFASTPTLLGDHCTRHFIPSDSPGVPGKSKALTFRRAISRPPMDRSSPIDGAC
jgi:hypothetical protein